ncbi:MAG: hypothetical protein N2517_06310 [Ignavibacteria bacterium]|nr:hypothetical protein [Ignavibacteria bacterium]
MEETKLKQTKKFSILNLFYKVSVAIVAFFLFFSLFLTFTLTFDFSKRFVINTIREFVNENINANLTFDYVSFNIFEGFVFKNILLTTSNDTLISANLLIVDWDFQPIFERKIFVKKLYLETPKVKIIKLYGDSLWNFEKIFVSKDKSKSEPPDISIFVNDFWLNQGIFVFRDFNKNTGNGQFSPTNLYLEEVGIKSFAKILLKSEEYSFNFSCLQFFESNSKFRLENLAGDIHIIGDTATLKNFRLETPYSHIKAEKALLNLEDFQLLINFGNSVISIEDAIRFTKIPLNPSALISFSGELLISERFDFKSFEIGFGKSSFQVNGYTKISAKSNEIDFFLSDVKIYEGDIKSIFPALSNFPFQYDFIYSNGLNFEVLGQDISVKGKVKTSLGILDFTSKLERFSKLHFNAKFNNLDVEKFGLNLPSSDLSGIASGALTLDEISTIDGYLNLDVQTGRTNFQGLDNFSLKLDASFDDGVIDVKDLLAIIYSNDTTFSENETAEIKVTGKLDFKNSDLPKYFGTLELNGLNLTRFKDLQKSYITNLTGSFSIEGIGFDPDNLHLKLKSHISEFEMADRALFPFDFNLFVNHNTNGKKTIQVVSDMMNIFVEGEYELTSLLKSFSYQFEILESVLVDKFTSLKTVSNFDSSNHQNKESKQPRVNLFSPANFTLKLSVRDVAMLSILIQRDIVFSGTANLQFKSSNDEVFFSLDTLNTNYLSVMLNHKSYRANNVNLSAKYYVRIVDSLAELQYLFLRATSENKLFLDKTFLDFLQIDLAFTQKELKCNLNTEINSTFGLRSNATAEFFPDNIKVYFNTLSFDYLDIFKWEEEEAIVLRIYPEYISFEEFNLVRENAEKINVSGKFYFDENLDLEFQVNSIPLTDFHKLFPKDHSISKIHFFDGKVESFRIKIKNTLSEPIVSLDLKSNNLIYEKRDLGILKFNAEYSESNLKFKMELRNRQNSLLSFEATKLPLVVNFKDFEFNLDENETVKGYLILENFDLSLLGPFVSKQVDELSGSLNANLEIYGNLPDDLKIRGNSEIINSSFLLLGNNLRYKAKGFLSFKENEIELTNIFLENYPEDLKNGNANIKGKIYFISNKLDEIDIVFSTNNFKVLSLASARSMPNLYGDLVVSTFPNSLRYFNRNSESGIEGTVTVTRGKLFMPSMSSEHSVQESFVRYEISSPEKKVKDTNETVSSKNGNREPERTTNNFVIDVSLRIQQQIELTLDVTSLGQIFALIGFNDPNASIRYFSDPKNNIYLLTGSNLQVREGSTLKFIKLFRTDGEIKFPTGSIDNPELNLKAIYEGQSFYNDAVRNFIVTIYITGTKEKPNLRFEYSLDGQTISDDSTKITQDAIFLLAFGQTKNEFERGGGRNFNLTEVSSSGSSALLSKLITDALSETGLISSASIQLPSSTVTSWDKATFRMSGTFLGLNWYFGGTMADLLNNNELSIELPLNAVLPQFFPNMIVQLSRSSHLTQTIQKNQKDWEIKLKYGSYW